MHIVTRFAIIGFSSLEAVALRRIISDDLGSLAECFRCFSDFSGVADRFDVFVTTPETALLNPDFFMTRKQRTLAVVDTISQGGSPFPVLARDSDERLMVETLRRLVDASREEPAAPGGLSSREIEVLRELASGKTNKEIADALCISVNTVITHRRNISSKLGIRSASGLSLYAMMNALI